MTGRESTHPRRASHSTHPRRASHSTHPRRASHSTHPRLTGSYRKIALPYISIEKTKQSLNSWSHVEPATARIHVEPATARIHVEPATARIPRRASHTLDSYYLCISRPDRQPAGFASAILRSMLHAVRTTYVIRAAALEAVGLVRAAVSAHAALQRRVLLAYQRTLTQRARSCSASVARITRAGPDVAAATVLPRRSLLCISLTTKHVSILGADYCTEAGRSTSPELS
jgi:hypothetical protein